MSSLQQVLLSLFCAVFLLSAASNQTEENKGQCFIRWAGNFSGLDSFPRVSLYFNVTGSKLTTIDIPDICPLWPRSPLDTKLVLQEIEVCNKDGFLLEITPPEDGSLSHMEVRCFVKILGVRIPCILKKVQMDVTVTEYCEPQDWKNSKNISPVTFNLTMSNSTNVQ